MDYGNIIVAVIAFIGTLIGSYLTSNKTTALILYRLDALEKKQDKHNSVIERTYSLEKEQAQDHAHIEEIRADVNRLMNKA